MYVGPVADQGLTESGAAGGTGGLRGYWPRLRQAGVRGLSPEIVGKIGIIKVDLLTVYNSCFTNVFFKYYIQVQHIHYCLRVRDLGTLNMFMIHILA